MLRRRTLHNQDGRPDEAALQVPLVRGWDSSGKECRDQRPGGKDDPFSEEEDRIEHRVRKNKPPREEEQ